RLLPTGTVQDKCVPNYTQWLQCFGRKSSWRWRCPAPETGRQIQTRTRPIDDRRRRRPSRPSALRAAAEILEAMISFAHRRYSAASHAAGKVEVEGSKYVSPP